MLNCSHASRGVLCYSVAYQPQRVQPGISGFPSHPSRGARATVIARFPMRLGYSDPTRPEASCATVSPNSPSSCNQAYRDSRRTLPEAPVLQ